MDEAVFRDVMVGVLLYHLHTQADPGCSWPRFPSVHEDVAPETRSCETPFPSAMMTGHGIGRPLSSLRPGLSPSGLVTGRLLGVDIDHDSSEQLAHLIGGDQPLLIDGHQPA